MKTEFKSDAENIYVRWHGRGAAGASRVAWIVEDVGDLVEPNFVVDETERSLRPPIPALVLPWAGRRTAGRRGIRLEFYINDELEETLHVTIVQ